jgi:hypothetical protein
MGEEPDRESASERLLRGHRIASQKRSQPVRALSCRANHAAYPHGEREPWMRPVRRGPATRGDMELLVEYLLTPPQTQRQPSQVSAALGKHFHELKVSGIMDYFYSKLQPALFFPLHGDVYYYLDAHDWTNKLFESEKKLLDSVKRFVLHMAITSANAERFAAPRLKADGSLDPSRLEEVDCLADFVADIVEIAKFLEDSCKSKVGHTPSLRDWVKERTMKLDADAKDGKRLPRRRFFVRNSERQTHQYARKICCVILGLMDDYDQSPEFGLTKSKDVFSFDTLEELLWKGFGFKFKVDPKEMEGMNGSIVDLDADFISTGPFQFVHTSRPQEHLTLDRHGKIRIYSSKALSSTAFMFQTHRIAK